MDFSVSADILAELLEVAVNLILYNRGIYPEGAFERRKKYSTPVQMCIHPGLSAYITDCVSSIKPVLEKGEVEKVVVAILSQERVLLEKFIFEILQSPKKPQDLRNDPKLTETETALRAFCSKLSICNSLLTPLPELCTFAVHLHVPEQTKEALASQPIQNFPWIEAEKDKVKIKDPQIIPIRSLKTEICEMQLYVEETGKDKR